MFDYRGRLFSTDDWINRLKYNPKELFKAQSRINLQSLVIGLYEVKRKLTNIIMSDVFQVWDGNGTKDFRNIAM